MVDSTSSLGALGEKLNEALLSRETRFIRRRLPDPTTSSSTALVDFNSNDYLSLSTSSHLRALFLSKLTQAPDILGSGGSRLLVNGQAHSSLEARLAHFFDAPAALLFNSGFDANVGFFSCIPQTGDVLVYDEYIHASVHDGIRTCRARDSQFSFSHNSVDSFKTLLSKLAHERSTLRSGESSLFVAVESLYSMDGTFAPLAEIVELLEEYFPKGNGHLVVDEAHSTGIYGPQGKGRVVLLGLEHKVLARLHTFGKALAATGAVILTNILIRDYLLNYARSLIYTTSLSYANIIAADCSFDMLVDGTAQKLASGLLDVSAYFVQILRPRLAPIPPELLSLPYHLQLPKTTDVQPTSNPSLSSSPSPIIPIMTSHPRPLSAYLLTLGMNARPITWPTVPKGKDRVRVCLHAANTRQDVEKLVDGMIRWAYEVLEAREKDETRTLLSRKAMDGVVLQSKL